MNSFKVMVLVCVLVGLLASTASAVNIATVPVGNPGNVGELSGASVPGGYGPDRICGSVSYEYGIGKYEITAGQYCEFLNAVARTDTYGLYNTKMADTTSYPCVAEKGIGCNVLRSGEQGSYSYTVALDWANRPVNYVSWGDAARFTNWMHNGQPTTGVQDVSTTENGSYYLNGATSDADLLAVTRKANATWVIPSEDEWYKAAYHKNDGVTGNYWDYPTGANAIPSHAVNSPDPGNNANYFGPSGSGNWSIDAPYFRTLVGEFENSESPYDTFDQGGNVWELNESVLYGSYRGMRGGSLAHIETSLNAGVRDYAAPTCEYYFIGFRLAVVPEPCSALMTLVGVFGLASIRRRG